MRAQSQGNYNDMIINNIVVEIVEKLSKVDAWFASFKQDSSSKWVSL